MLKLSKPFDGSFKLLIPTPETPAPVIAELAERPPTPVTPPGPRPIFYPVAAFIMTRLLAEGGLLPTCILVRQRDSLTAEWLANSWFFVQHV